MSMILIMFRQGQWSRIAVCLRYDDGVATMCGDCINSTVLSLHNGCRWRRCWRTAKNLRNYTSAHYARCHHLFHEGMKTTYVMLVFVWEHGCGCAGVMDQRHISSRLLSILNMPNWPNRC